MTNSRIGPITDSRTHVRQLTNLPNQNRTGRLFFIIKTGNNQSRTLFWKLAYVDLIPQIRLFSIDYISGYTMCSNVHITNFIICRVSSFQNWYCGHYHSYTKRVMSIATLAWSFIFPCDKWYNRYAILWNNILYSLYILRSTVVRIILNNLPKAI